MKTLKVKQEDGTIVCIPIGRGANGRSAYEYAKAGGYTGTEVDFAKDINPDNINAKSKDYIITELAKRSQTKIEIVDIIEEMEDINKLYVLSADGYIYSGENVTEKVKYHKELATEFEEGTFDSTGEIVESDEGFFVCTDYIDFSIPTNPDFEGIIYVRGFDYSKGVKVAIYYDNKNCYDVKVLEGQNGSGSINYNYDGQFLKINNSLDSNAAFLRIAGVPEGKLEDICISIDEEPFSLMVNHDKWTSTDLAFIPADYEDRIIDLEDEVLAIRDDINKLPDQIISELENNTIIKEVRTTASEASQIANDTRSSILDDISTSSFYLKELRDIDTLKKDTEFISVMNEGTFKSQSAENEKTSTVLYKNKEVIRSTTTSGNLTAEFRRAFPTGGFLDILGTQEFDIIVYIDDVTKISKIELKLSTYIDTERGVTQTKTANQLHNGWNYLRFLTTNLPLEQWGECKILRVVTYTTEPSTVYYGDIIQVKPNKARIIFVDDHAYSDFKTNAYPALKSQGIPVTWAIQPGRIGLSIADSGTLLTEEDITELSNDPYSEFSWHSYDGTDTSSMSSAELQTDCKKSITFLRKSGLLPKHYWRAAWKHNNAPNARSCDDLMDGGAYYDTIGRPEVFPFTNKYNISRYSIHRRTQADIDSIFNILQKTHCTVVFYTHSFITVADDSESNTTNNVTNIEFDYFMSKIATGVSEGWIEGTTFDWLMRKYGIAEF